MSSLQGLFSYKESCDTICKNKEVHSPCPILITPNYELEKEKKKSAKLKIIVAHEMAGIFSYTTIKKMHGRSTK